MHALGTQGRRPRPPVPMLERYRANVHGVHGKWEMYMGCRALSSRLSSLAGGWRERGAARGRAHRPTKWIVCGRAREREACCPRDLTRSGAAAAPRGATGGGCASRRRRACALARWDQSPRGQTCTPARRASGAGGRARPSLPAGAARQVLAGGTGRGTTLGRTSNMQRSGPNVSMA